MGAIFFSSEGEREIGGKILFSDWDPERKVEEYKERILLIMKKDNSISRWRGEVL